MLKCQFCGMPEKGCCRPPAKTEYICSRCVTLFLATTAKQARAAYQKALDYNLTSKAEALETFFSEVTLHGQQETGQTRSDMVRERPLRTIRPSRYEQRAQQAII